MSAALPGQARVVIAGAGALGCAIAWQLAEAGIKDVLVIEKARITHGSTWHAAGLVGQLRSRPDLTRLMRGSVAILNAIQAEEPIDWKPAGSLRVASSEARAREIRRSAEDARGFGVDAELIGAAEVQRRFPLADPNGIVLAAHIAGDGHVDPSSVTQAYARRARKLGVRFAEETLVTGVAIKAGRAVAVQTARGDVVCEILVNAAGVWARGLGKLMGMNVPAAAIQHQYAVTEKIAGVTASTPSFREPDLSFYVKPDAGALAIGGWEASTDPACPGDMPVDFGRQLLPQSDERLLEVMTNAMRRIPALEHTGIRTVINGPIPVSPDGEPILGLAPGFENIYLAAGFTSGIAASGGAGRWLAGLIANGEPEYALPSLEPKRFSAFPSDLKSLNVAAIAAYAAYYALPARFAA